MANIARLVAMETLLENIADKLVMDVKEGELPMNNEVLECLETVVEAAQKTQIVRESAEREQELPSKKYRLAC